MQESILYISITIWSFYPKFRNCSCSVVLKTIILVRTINKCFQKYFQNVKKYHKQPNKHLLKTNVNSIGKLSKTTLKYIELTELKILFYYALQANIKSLKWDSILNTSQQNIKNSIQRGVRQLCTTNRYRITEVFLEPALLFSGQNKYVNIRRL